MFEILILVVVATTLVLFFYFFTIPKGSLTLEEQENLRMAEALKNIFYYKIPGFDKTLAQIFGDRINTNDEIIDYGRFVSGINSTALAYEYFEKYYGRKWALNFSTLEETTSIIWIPNSEDGNSVSKISATSGRELGRYYTVATGITGNPSRVSLDSKGNVWVGNRNTNTLVKIGLKEKGECVDKNNDGVIETSEDLNSDGIIDSSEMIKFEDDECVLANVILGSKMVKDLDKTGTRAVCVDANDNVYAGLYGDKKLFYVSREGNILNEWDLSSYIKDSRYGPYGCFVDSNNVVWISLMWDKALLKFDPSTDTFTRIEIGKVVYGIAPCQNEDCLIINCWTDSSLIKLNTTTGIKIFDKRFRELPQGRGIIADEENYIYAVSTSNSLIVKFDKDGNIITKNSTCNNPTGVGEDIFGKIWVTCIGDNSVWRFDKNLNVELKTAFGTSHYVYNFFTSYKTPPIVIGKDVGFGYLQEKTERLRTFVAPIPIPSYSGKVINFVFRTW
jgi:streptogramin lyase